MSESEEFLYDTDAPALSEEMFNLFNSWELSMKGISLLLDCRITTLSTLKYITLDDINAIFDTKEYIGDRACFRYHLRQWRIENNVSTELKYYWQVWLTFVQPAWNDNHSHKYEQFIVSLLDVIF